MCGINGCLGPNNWINIDNAKLTINTMNQCIQHRGMDDSGHYFDIEHGVLLGHQRLSIIDIDGGAQPLEDTFKRAIIVFNGEIYNYKTLKLQLINLGHTFSSNSDTEVLLNAYLEWGENCLDRLRGMFSFAIWDKNKNKLFCARDRLGIKPFYYFWNGTYFVFSSEIKAILLHPKVTKENNVSALSNYLQYQYIQSPQTIYKNIYKLQAGYFLNIVDQTLTLNSYWDLNKCRQTTEVTPDELSKKIRCLLEESVELHLQSDAPLGAFLSGGIDSTAIVALMSQKLNKPVLTHTARFNQSAYDESQIAKEVSNYYKTDHYEAFADINIADDLEKIIYQLDEPFADASAIPTYYLCKQARKRVKVCLSGDGGDELFAGYNWYNELLKLEGLQHQVPSSLMSGASSLLSGIWPTPLKGAKFLKNLGLNPQQQHSNLVSYFDTSELEKICHFSLNESNQYLANNNSSNNKRDDVVNDAQRHDIQTYLVEDILMKVDKMSMAHGLEVRVPLLDHHLVEMAVTIPSKMLINKNERKIAFRNSLKGIVPNKFLNRKKQGFNAPVGHWLKGELKEQFGDLLLSTNSKNSGMFDHNQIEKLWNRSNKNYKYAGLNEKLWTLFCFEMWHSVYN